MYCSNCGQWMEGDKKLCKACEDALAKASAPMDETTEETADTAGVPPTDGGVPPYHGEVPPYGYYYNNQGYYQPGMNGYYSTEPDPTNRMYGFGKALTSTILSFFAVLFAYIAMIAGLIEPTAGVVLLLFSLPCTVIAFVYGLKSINTFRARKATCAKPIPTLILGIEGVSSSGAAIIMSLFALLMIAIGSAI